MPPVPIRAPAGPGRTPQNGPPVRTSMITVVVAAQRPQPKIESPSSQSAVLAVRALQLKEVAAPAVRQLLLIDEVQPALVERLSCEYLRESEVSGPVRRVD